MKEEVMRSLTLVVVLVLAVMVVGGCGIEKGGTVVGPSETSTGPRNISAEPLPSTHQLTGGGTVTLLTASVVSYSGPGEVFLYCQDPLPSKDLLPVLFGSKGETIEVSGTPCGVFYPLHGVVPKEVVVTKKDGSTTKFNMAY